MADLCGAGGRPGESLAEIRGDADETVCLSAPAGFQAVGQFYRSFEQVEDEEVVDCLRSRRERNGVPAGSGG